MTSANRFHEKSRQQRPNVLEVNFRSSEFAPPQNVEIEESVLGGCLIDPYALGRVLALPAPLVPEYFYLGSHQTIFRAMLALREMESSVGVIEVAGWLRDRNLLDRIGGSGKLVQLAERTISAVNIDKLAESLVDKWLRREIMRIGSEIYSLGSKVDESVADLLDECRTKLDRIGFHSRSDLRPAEEAMTEFLLKLENAISDGRSPTLESGFYDLDALLGGFSKTDLVVVLARTNMGKTHFLINLARQVLRQQKPVVIFSVESSEQEIYARFASLESGFNGRDVAKGKLTIDQFVEMTSRVDALLNAPLFVDDNSYLNVSQIRAQLARICAITGQEIGMVGLDYFQLLQSGSKWENRTKELEHLSSNLKAIAKEFQVPFFVLAQAKRDTDSRNNKRPTMSDVRDCDTLSHVADTVLGLYRDEYYNPDTPDVGIAEVLVLKNRNGPTGTIKLLFNPDRSEFKNLARNY